ncbi:Uncharacterised protein [Neisseria zoodegmatis]|uniref:Uncharacterized protein n=1 Tax=Neisseria zoodegmatis TaxID=326523 RepID=A0A378WRP7_9NEIS|nr:Uncharacterised protein [Neisseria zoodegmatis]
MLEKDSEYQAFKFQHTAARRRLNAPPSQYTGKDPVSTHSRPKAADLYTSYACLL